MIEYLRKNKWPYIIAIIQWIICMAIHIDKLFFEYDRINGMQIIVKALYLLTLIFLWLLLFRVLKEIKAGNREFQWGLSYFTIYFIILMSFMAVIWPGTWFWDDLITLQAISGYHLDVWHHVLTGIYQAVLLQLLPFPAGLIILQNLIISICVARLIVIIEKSFLLKRSKNLFLILFKLFPFLLPPVLSYQFSGFRLGIYSYLELLFLVEMISAIKSKRKWGIRFMLYVCTLSVLTAAWRTESALYIPVVCAIIWFMDESMIVKKQKVTSILMILCGFTILFTWQKIELNDNDYVLISFINPCTELVRMSDPKIDQLELEKIGKIVNLQMVHQNPRKTGEMMFFTDKFIKEGYSKKEYKGFLEALLSLCVKYPKVFWTERWNTFLRSVELAEKTKTNLYDAFDEFNKNEMMAQVKDKNWFAFKPIFLEQRRRLIYFWRGKNSKGVNTTTIMRLEWNAVIPILLLCYGWIKLLKRKKYMLFIFISAFMIKIPIIFLMEPEGYMLYFLSFYLTGYVYGCFFALLLWEIHSKKVKSISNLYA